MVKVDLKFDVDPGMAFGFVRGSLENRNMRIASNKAGAVVKSKMVALAPVDKGLVKKSIRIKVKFYKRTKVWATMCGPSKAVKRAVNPKKNRKLAPSERKYKKATRYVHIIEFHQGPAFMRPAVSLSKQQYLAILRAETANALKQVGKYRRR